MIRSHAGTVQFFKTLSRVELTFREWCLMTSDQSDSSAANSHWMTSASLLARAREQDDDAWKRIVHLYGPLVAHWCRQATVSARDIDDVVQEIFLSIARELAQFRYDRPGDSFRGWIRVITRRRVADHFRGLNGRPSAEGGTTAYRRLNEVADPVTAYFDSDPEADSENSSIACRSLELIRNDFQPSTWAAFWRTAIDNIPTAEVAEQLRMSQSAVRMARSRVLNRLKQELVGLVSLSENSFPKLRN
jgi:RNA polymerase sigma-70 factor (ECF subfamily)